MRSLASAFYSIAVAVWVGSLLAIGFIAAPVLFTQLADRSLAGSLAGAMFNIMAWVGLVCGTYLILFVMFAKGWRAIQSGVFWIVLLMLGLTIAGHFGVQPILAQLQADALPRRVMESAMRDRFTTWHGVSSALYVAQCLLGIALAILQERGKGR
jgi:MFS family permease